MIKLTKVLLGLALATMVNGCVQVSLHTTYLVKVHATERADGQPLTNASVSVEYGQIAGYGVYYVLRVPKSEAATTDTNGDAIIPLATFSQYINFFVDGNKFALTSELIRLGGKPECVAEWHPPAADVTLTRVSPDKPHAGNSAKTKGPMNR